MPSLTKAVLTFCFVSLILLLIAPYQSINTRITTFESPNSYAILSYANSPRLQTAKDQLENSSSFHTVPTQSLHFADAQLKKSLEASALSVPSSVGLTLNYSIHGGGSGYFPPLFTYEDTLQTQTLVTGQTVTVTAYATVEIIVTSNPIGTGFVKVDDTAVTTPATFSWTPDDTHKLEALSPVSGNTGIQYVWTGWSDDGTQTHTYTVPSASATVTANYQTQYYLTVTSPYVSPTGAGWYNSGSSVSSTVTRPVSGGTGVQYETTGWTGTGSLSSGGSEGSSSTGSFTINAYSTCTWNWKTQYRHIIMSSPTGNGYVVVDGIGVTTPYTTSWWDSGSSHTIAANSPVTVVSGQSQYIWTSWSDSEARSHTVSPTWVTTFTANFQLQYYLSVSGGDGTGAGWYNSGAAASSTAGYVLNQVAGQSRNNLVSKTVDGSTTSLTRANSGTSTQPFTMSAYHSITWNYNTQYYLTVTGGNSIGFGTVSPTGDQWYDSGVSTTVSSKGVWSVTLGEGFRIASYSIDGGAPVDVAPTTGTFIVPAVRMDVPHKVAFNSVTQYEVRLDTGALESLNYITTPTVSGYKYWYDSRTSVDVMLNGVWNRASGTGKRLVSYAINGRSETSISSLEKVPALSLASITSSQYITTKITTQFTLNTPSGSLASITPTPISGDTGWYDNRTAVTAVYNYVWNETADQSRMNAIGFNIDGGTENTLPRAGSGTFTATVTMNAPHTINIASVMQYLIYFRFTDNSSSKQIIPTSFEIDVQGVGAEEVQGSRIWLDRGISFRISKEIWGNMDVKPQDQVVYRVDRPLNETIRSRIFDGKLKVIDMLGISTPGAQIIVTLANGTQITGIADADGYFIIPMIPLGRFNATISNLGTSTQIDGDASKQSVTEAKVVLSYPTIIAIAIIAVVACLIYWIQNPPRVRKPNQPIDKKSQPKRLPTTYSHLN